GAALDRAGLARDGAAPGAHAFADGGDVGRADREVAEGGAEFVGIDAVVVGQLDLGAVGARAVAEEGELVLLLRPVRRAAQRHAEVARVEVDRALQVADAQHRVEEFHPGAPSSSMRAATGAPETATVPNIAVAMAAGSLTRRSVS